MKRNAWLIASTIGLFLNGGLAQAGWEKTGAYGYQPVWSIFSHRDKTPQTMQAPRGETGRLDQLGLPMNPYVPANRYIPSPVNPMMQFVVPRTEIPESRILLVDGPGGF
jgi:hypothetical protein